MHDFRYLSIDYFTFFTVNHFFEIPTNKLPLNLIISEFIKYRH